LCDGPPCTSSPFQVKSRRNWRRWLLYRPFQLRTTSSVVSDIDVGLQSTDGALSFSLDPFFLKWSFLRNLSGMPFERSLRTCLLGTFKKFDALHLRRRTFSDWQANPWLPLLDIHVEHGLFKPRVEIPWRAVNTRVLPAKLARPLKIVAAVRNVGSNILTIFLDIFIRICGLHTTPFFSVRKNPDRDHISCDSDWKVLVGCPIFFIYSHRCIWRRNIEKLNISPRDFCFRCSGGNVGNISCPSFPHQPKSLKNENLGQNVFPSGLPVRRRHDFSSADCSHQHTTTAPYYWTYRVVSGSGQPLSLLLDMPVAFGRRKPVISDGRTHLRRVVLEGRKIILLVSKRQSFLRSRGAALHCSPPLAL